MKRYDCLIKDTTIIVKQIDDTLLWADTALLEDSYRRTVEYLKLAGNNCIIINKKFIFAEIEQDYASLGSPRMR